ncbi:MAG: metallophosphoesterase, partial [Planctomycetes bacterium]|nr:metallophosphoesterase [Planctomycetota bacterium]
MNWFKMYDIIGDIHGHADEFVELLELLGYDNESGVYRHPTRTTVFVGDFIDRGPQICEVLRLVRSMHESSSALAVMGNHEFNALAYHTPDPTNPDRHLRDHSEKNTNQHAATLSQVPVTELNDHLEWFRRLPMWLELNGLRIVHACWDADQISVIETARNKYGGVSAEFLYQATKRGTQLFQAIEDVLKGKEVNLPG